MGHHFSKPIVRANSQDQSHSHSNADLQLAAPVPAAIVEAIGLDEEELQVEEILSEATAASPAEVRQIIIKIQLAKMEQQVEEHQPLAVEQENQVAAALSADALNANGQQQQRIVNVTLERGTGEVATGEMVGVVGSSAEAPKNNNFAGSVGAAISTLQLHDANSNNCHEEQPIAAVGDGESRKGAENFDIDDHDDDDDDVVDESLLRRRRSNSHHHHHHSHNEAEVVEYCEVLESLPVSNMSSSATQHTSKQGSRNTNNSNSCCRSRSSKTLSMGAATSSSSAAAGSAATSSKRRCCKCKCRDAFRGLRDMLPTSGGGNNSNSNSSAHGKKESSSSAATVGTVSRKSRTADRRSTPPTLGASSTSTQHRLQSQRKRNSVAVPDASHQHHQVIIRITSPGFVVESPGGGRVTVITEPAPLTPLTPPQSRPLIATAPSSVSGMGHRNLTVHSQIDFMHCLVPDLEKITNSSFYWGKMDRYEAEHLLEGKPEGTFLLRDSAQDEFLFSVTFRKYGRSLHARIEQSGHKFSFDCHDPCVFTAPTVTGLLEHYKDPACVMFFEPCLTIPLHRRQTFSLQQLARATIVSNTSYDGINQLGLPGRLKSYLKEYHYKQKLRVKPIDQNTPVPYYGDV